MLGYESRLIIKRDTNNDNDNDDDEMPNNSRLDEWGKAPYTFSMSHMAIQGITFWHTVVADCIPQKCNHRIRMEQSFNDASQ